jgi:hypothetical protein
VHPDAMILSEGPLRRDLRLAIGLQLVRLVEEVGAVAERHLPEHRSVRAVDAVGVREVLAVAPTW